MDDLSLRLFLAIARRGTISEAARELDLSPASASARLSALEREVGARLVHRTTRRLSLSEDGGRFLPFAQEAVGAIDQGLALTRAATPDLHGTLRLTAPASFGRLHLMPLLPDLMARHPALAIDLRLGDAIVDLVDGGFDLAIRNAELPDSSLIARRLAPDRRFLMASPAYLDRRGVPATPDEIPAHACLALGDQTRWSFAGIGGAIRTVEVQPVLRVSDGEALRQACEAGIGLAILSTWLAHEALRAGRLAIVLGNRPLASAHAIWAVMPSSRLVAPKVRAVVDLVAAAFNGAPWDQGLA